MKRLFIFIPTWRRHALLEAQIERILIAIGEHQNVHVLVSSNGESIENFPKLSKLIQEDKRFDFRFNPSNIGANANILLGFVLANPDDALWILADDNPITSESISLILENLNSDWEILGMATSQNYEERFIFDNNKYGLKYLGENTDWGLISSVVYNIGAVADYVFRGFELHNSSFPHLGILLEAANKKGGLRVSQINANLIHLGNISETDSDYSQSLTGSPVLFIYETKKRRKSMARKWLWENGSALFANRKRYPQEYLLTKALLRKWCGLAPFYFMFIFSALEQTFYESRMGKRLRLSLRNSNFVRLIFKNLGKPIHLQRNL